MKRLILFVMVGILTVAGLATGAFLYLFPHLPAERTDTLGIAEVIETSARERDNLACIEAVDRVVMDIRDRLRRGQRIEENIAWPH